MVDALGSARLAARPVSHLNVPPFMIDIKPIVQIWLPLILFCGSMFAQDETSPAQAKENSAKNVASQWEQKIRPLFAKNCFECHNSIERSGKLDVESIAGLFNGGLSGSAIDVNSPATSLLLAVLSVDAKPHMPPEGQLADADFQLLRNWIEELSKIELPKAWTEAKASAQTEIKKSIHEKSSANPLPLIALGVDPSLAIDIAIEQQWKANQIVGAPIASDTTFVRRIYLDLMGRIPKTSELSLFLQSTDSRKREQLVDSILSSEECAVHLAEVFDVLLTGRNDVGQTDMAHKAGWMKFLTKAIAENRPWNEVAKQVLLARPNNAEDAGAVWYLYSRKNKHQDIAEAVSRDFFGVRIDCAQCHDHPLAPEIEQRHYWGLTAFFNRSSNVDSPKGPRVGESAIGGYSEFANLRGSSSVNDLVFLGGKQVPETRPAKDVKEEDRDDLYILPGNDEPKVPKFSRRERFVEDILVGHPLVAAAMVNRMWGWILGRGLIHPVDAMDSFHPASHPELLGWLSRDFEHSGYDLRRLLRNLALSRTYQLSDHAATAETDPKWFAYAIAKPLTAETLYRSMQVALDIEDPNAWNTNSQRVAFAKIFPDVLAEESLANVAQGLLLTNGESIQRMVTPAQSKTVREAIGNADNQSAIRFLFNRILGREPDEEESKQSIAYFEARQNRRPKAIEGLAWAMLTSAEFRFSH
jgi:Protein of unknown function (DUF1549)/Protein of unknown function (DUF1553)/Planctomycete cytochrome C